MRTVRGDDAQRLVRLGLVALTVVDIVGTAFELATERHWRTAVQLVPWGALVLLALTVALYGSRRRRGVIAWIRGLAGVVLLLSLFGIYEHVSANYAAGPLDQRYATTWDALPWTTRWWYALTKTVGPSPPLAPATLAQAAILMLLATVGERGPGHGPE
ncbi:hypothetical protein N5079_13360 [Planotetraspora sp. A-T 1434]|uniref:hypothetical protein n=1 Tax=Planotetraspora sp. A-T 1434 TaxID=2979219 RepID=UPI0021BE467B|nr:hypothetical protein [Planotetraspora sp. A-T 1434]MCT9931204.1 hypothetical protein [Planotetraspora sp. A-T 1434]